MPNSIQSWEELVEKFHKQFYRPGMNVSVASLARMGQALDELPMEYLTRFKSPEPGAGYLFQRPNLLDLL